jgi:DNA primase
MLNEKKLYSYFDSRFDIRKSTKGWYSMDCPYCNGGRSNERSGAINFESEQFKCWRAKCGVHKSAIDFIKDFEKIPFAEVRSFIDGFRETFVAFDRKSTGASFGGINTVKKDINLPFGYKSLLDGSDILSLRAQRYLSKRGFDLDKLDANGWGFCSEEHENFKLSYYGYIIIPFVVRGRFVYYIGRDFLGRNKKWKYKNPDKNMFGVGKSEVIYNEDALSGNIVYVHEGALCAETVGSQGIGTLGWALSDVQRNKILKSQCKVLIVAADKGFYHKAIKLMISFLEVKKEIRIVSFEDMDDKENDVNAIGKSRYMEMVEKTQPLTFGLAMDILTS